MSDMSHRKSHFASRALAGLVGLTTVLLATIPASPAFAAFGDWSTPIPLSEAGQNAENPQISVSTDGEPYVTWSRHDDSIIMRAQATGSLDFGASWSTTTTLSGANQEAVDSRVAVDADGNAIAIWYRSNGSNYIVQTSRSEDGGVSWSAPVDLSTVGRDAYAPQVAFDADGTAIAVWNRFDGTSYVVQSSRSTDGGVSWTSPATLSVSGGDAYGAQVAVDSDGTAVVAWYRTNGSNFIVQSSRSLDGGVNWSAPVDLSQAGQEAYEPFIDADAAGNTVVVWRRSDGSDYIAQATASSDGGATWSTPANLSAPGYSAESPRLSANADGQIVVVWYRNVDGNYRVQTSSSVDGGVTWSTAVNLSASGRDGAEPQVDVDPAGNAIVVWRRNDGSFNRIQASRSTDGGASWSAPEDVSPAGTNGILPDVDVDPAGNAYVVWRHFNGSNHVIHTSRSLVVSDSTEELAETGSNGIAAGLIALSSLGILTIGVVLRRRLRHRTV